MSSVKLPFSAEIMARFSTITVPVECMDQGKIPAAEFLHWVGSYSSFLDLCRDTNADPTKAGRACRNDMEEKFSDRWAGIRQPLAQVLQSGFIASAFESFKRAEAKLEADRFQPSAVKHVVSGPVWITPQVLAGNARPARIRERTKLPPKNLSIALSVFGGIDHEDITASVAKIARGAWDYIQAGGAVTLTVHYSFQFKAHLRMPNGPRGVIFSVRVPLTNQSAFATAISAQLYRGMAMAIRNAMQGDVDGGPVVTHRGPGVLHLTGRPHVDGPALALIGVR